ncbi:MAG: aconitase/3-isopropylmalate dehydratase large subunit family protein [Desulfobacterales bacterium]|jgi:3-isopropylmalate/(R)-2-methylmalate dehydratase large subunit
MSMTFAEKILSAKAGLTTVRPGQIITIKPDVALSHDNTAAIYHIFKQMGAKRVKDPQQLAFFADHAAPASSTQHAENHRITREFAIEQGVENCFSVGRGICHQVLVEEGLALPGEVVLGADSHTTHAGAMGAFGAGIGRSEMASVWALGHLWLMVPESLKIMVHGKLPLDVTSKDLALYVIGKLGADAAIYMSVEWHGEVVENLSLDARAVLSNISAELGAKNSYLPPNQATFNYLKGKAQRIYNPVYPDSEAVYARTKEFSADEIGPTVACPHSVDNVRPLKEVAGIRIDQAFLGTCTNGRLEDLALAAAILEKHKVHPRTRFIVIPASAPIYIAALQAGYLETLAIAGALIGPPGCGPCLGSHLGVPAEGEVTVSSANRNFQGRMGTRASKIYLASPAVVAASAVAGSLTHPGDL